MSQSQAIEYSAWFASRWMARGFAVWGIMRTSQRVRVSVGGVVFFLAEILEKRNVWDGMIGKGGLGWTYNVVHTHWTSLNPLHVFAVSPFSSEARPALDSWWCDRTVAILRKPALLSQVHWYPLVNRGWDMLGHGGTHSTRSHPFSSNWGCYHEDPPGAICWWGDGDKAWSPEAEMLQKMINMEAAKEYLGLSEV